MKRLIPIGYTLSESGRTAGVIFGSFSVLLTAAMLFMEGGIIQAVPFIVLAVLFFSWGFISDYTFNRKARPKIEFMNEMLGMTEVPGRIISTEKKAVYFGKETDTTESMSAKNVIYRFTVAYTDPFSGELRQTVSETYSHFTLHEKPEGRLKLVPCYDKETVTVYCGRDGKVWVELIYRDPNNK